jgi:DNA-binding LacI/PurR family transcriptional regulator
LDDVAKVAGVSRATVSRVLNGGSASEATRARVADAVERTGYRPNAAARRLASGRSGVVGIVMHVDARALFSDPYFSQLLQGICDGLAERAAGMMVWLANRTKEQTLEEILGIGLLDGVVVTADTLSDPLVDGLLASPLPTVLIGHRTGDRSASYVDIDHTSAAREVTRHLIGLGRTRVGHVSGRRGTVAGEDRIAGYLDAMREAGLDPADLVVEGDFSSASGAVGAERLVDAGVDAIFCANDAMAAGALEALARCGLLVPDDVAVAGFDDLEFAADLDPPLTTVRQGVRAQGTEAARVLFELVADPEAAPRGVVLPTELVVRASSVGVARSGGGPPDRRFSPRWATGADPRGAV